LLRKGNPMKCRKPICLFLVAAFVQLTMSCYSTKNLAPEQMKQPGKSYKIVRVLKKSGETVDFDKDNPALLYGNEIRGSIWVRVKVQGTAITKEGDVYIFKTKDGVTYKAETYRRDEDSYVLMTKSTMSIPLSDVSLVWARVLNSTNTIVLAVVGGIIVVTGLVLLIVALTKKSCPFLYSEGATGFNLEGELYSGAIFKGAERRDFLKLHSLAAGPDGYVLKVTNEADETQYTDEMTLVAVDHPKDVRVYFGSDGIIHTVRAPLAALSAVDFEGRDFTPLLSASDGRMWSSNPFGKDPENPAYWRSGLTLRFPKPMGARAAKLVVRIGNTFWADQAFGNLMAMMGGMMPAWYQQSEQTPDIREQSDKFMSDEGIGLKVQVLGREGWRDTGFFYPTGPFGIKDDIMVLPLEGTPDGGLTVRLQGGTFFWMVDYAAVDYSTDIPVAARELAPTSAVADNGKDVQPSLLRPDGDYFVMPEPGEYALVKYPAPPLRAGLARSFFLRSTGYYTIHPTETGSPDVLKLLAIQKDPDLFLKFSLQEIQKRLLAAAGPRSAPSEARSAR
jgi:hypothetical protein